MKTQKKFEKGQILILFVFGLIGLLGLTALAIDGGMVYTDRRYAQSVADAAALAGAQAAEEYINSKKVSSKDFVCSTLDINTAEAKAAEAAQDRADDNKIAIEDGVIDPSADPENRVTVECKDDRYLDIQVALSTETKTSFAHIVTGRQSIRNQVISIVRLFGPVDVSQGNAIVALNDGNCIGQNPGLVFSGNDETSITNGGVFSNSCITTNGGITVDIDGGGAYYVATPKTGDWDGNGSSGSFVPTPELSTTPFPRHPLPEPKCDELDEQTVDTGTQYLYSGRYPNGISITNGGKWTMEQGLYCITGDMTVTGGELYSSGYGVTLYFEPAAPNKPSTLDIGGNATVVLKATSREEEYLFGLLIYMPPHNEGTIKIVGTSESYYEGTIYAPESNVHIGGTEEMGPTGSPLTSPTFNTNIIGLDVTISGTSDITINNDSELRVILPSSADQHK